jgi:2,3-bisphosphoglycerate-dependent phosphoglycerate mutase
MSKLILMRHGQSAWNEQNLFTGWVDIPLSEAGIRESIEGGRQIKDIPIDVIFTSTLIRAHMTLALAMLHHAEKKVPVFQHVGTGKKKAWNRIFSKEAVQRTIPVYCAWQLNERMYGELQGLNKAEMAKKFGAEQLHLWRRSFDVAPPGGESLAMTAKRAIPYFNKEIKPRLQKGENVLIVAHGNSLRAIVMDLDKLDQDQIVKRELATGAPIIYTALKKSDVARKNGVDFFIRKINV